MTANVTLPYRVMRIATLVAIVISLAFPQQLAAHELVIAAILIVLLGIPHGATDHLIFRQLSQPFLGAKGLWRFYLHYLLLMAAYALLWWLLPTLALTIFLAISCYHFGQSNWASFAFSNQVWATITYIIWGALILFTPILWHYEAASIIISSIIGKAIPILSTTIRLSILVSLLFINLGVLIYYWRQQLLSTTLLLRECINIFLLIFLFLTTPLLLGFTIYFVVWHSLGSTLDQIRFFQLYIQHYNWKKYAWQTLPLSFAAIAGLGLLFWVKGWLGLTADIGLLFIFIAVITLPHALLIDRLYKEWQVQPA